MGLAEVLILARAVSRPGEGTPRIDHARIEEAVVGSDRMRQRTVVDPQDSLTRRDLNCGGSKADALHRYGDVGVLRKRRTGGSKKTHYAERGPQDARAQTVGTRHG